MRNRKNTQAVPDVPFCVGRSSGVSLARQIADGIRSAIASGYYRPGQILPTRKEFAQVLGVSERAPREAVAMLAAEGVVYTRRCLGCVVAEPGERRWLGKILLVESEYAHYYYHATVFDAFCRRMAEAGYVVTRIVCPELTKGVVDTALLKDALQQPLDFVVSLQTDRRVISLLKNAGVRHLVFLRDKGAKSPEKGITIDYDGALKNLIAQCRSRGVRSIVQVGVKGMSELLDLRPYVSYTGIGLVSWDLTIAQGRIGAEKITFGALKAFQKRLAFDRKWLPDLLFFRDDYLSVGALPALLDAGVRVPEDVRVVTLANRGNCPVFPKALARVELDPRQNGIAYAERVLHEMAPRRYKNASSGAFKYIPGETFP